MKDIAGFAKSIFSAEPNTFDSKALAIFQFQAKENDVYREFLHYLDISPDKIRRVEDIPFLPISIFKSRDVLSGNAPVQLLFESSGTGDQVRSKHLITDPELYAQSYLRGFELVYGNPKNWCILALLPSYLERTTASLVHMCKGLMDASGHPDNGFYLHDLGNLSATINRLKTQGQQVLLVGVTFALLDLAADFPMQIEHVTILETGGMKGKREEITRAALHQQLLFALHPKAIHSEYGMTELLSQAYCTDGHYFKPSPWMKILVRDSEDPFLLLPYGKSGCLNVIDLANIYSCSFIATDDIGALSPDGRFTVLGRFDKSDLRGCNLMVE